MNLMLACLALNEMEHLPSLLSQHRNWKGADQLTFVFVESADVTYAEANPTMVTADGLSVDGTTEYLDSLARQDERVIHIPFGFSRSADKAQGKTEARTQYLRIAEQVKPDFLFVLDADEHYTYDHQARISRLMALAPHHHTAFMFGLRTIWRPPSIADQPLFNLEAIGCLFSVPICRGWRYIPGMRYTANHNTPCDSSGALLLQRGRVSRFDLRKETPYCVHLGFTSSLASRVAKRKYYVARGEGQGDGRQKYVDCRRWFETYQPGDKPPHGVRIIEYQGEVPEVFR